MRASEFTFYVIHFHFKIVSVKEFIKNFMRKTFLNKCSPFNELYLYILILNDALCVHKAESLLNSIWFVIIFCLKIHFLICYPRAYDYFYLLSCFTKTPLTWKVLARFSQEEYFSKAKR